MPSRTLLAAALLLLAAGPSHAEPRWMTGQPTYELTGADLFALRDDLPDELDESLKAIRNQSFADAAAFRAALDAALITETYRAEWTDRLIATAEAPAASFGVETLDGNILTLWVDDDQALDANPFTAQTWLPHLTTEADPTGWTLEQAEGCLAIGYEAENLFRLCDATFSASDRSVSLTTDATSVVGLGQEFLDLGNTTVDRLGTVRTGLNQMTGFNGGANGNTLFPIAYFERDGRDFALILDNRYPQRWDFSASPYTIAVEGGDLRFRVLTGETRADIRRQFMALAGRPPVPPKAMFGLWLSEYGFDSWSELDDKLASLRAAGFPVSGVVMDLQWFGGIAPNAPDSRMGSLTWDTEAFPDPADKIAALRAEGIGMMLIEEPYISRDLEEFDLLGAAGGLAHDPSGTPMLVNPAGNWWGLGGLLDPTNTDAMAAWHDLRRQALIDMGMIGHWTDLGEPEMYAPGFQYGDGITQSQVHNSFNLLWLKSIADGYVRSGSDQRPFMMSRSGGIGMAELGAAMWSADTGSDFLSLASQFPQQTHMVWSGIDYYGSDVGGFHRGALKSFTGDQEAAMDELYTRWLAYAALFEIPIRPHTENLCNCKETAPDRIGDLKSNLANLQLRYALLPYYYSLAYRAWRDGEPIFPSLDYEFPEDPNAIGLGTTKMIGPFIAVGLVAEQSADAAETYLPEGLWFPTFGLPVMSEGQAVTNPLRYPASTVMLQKSATDPTMIEASIPGGPFMFPLYFRDGAIIPTDRGDGLISLQIFGTASSEFSIFDDDGTTTGYRQGIYDRVDIALDGDTLTLTRGVGGTIDIATLRWTRPTLEPVADVIIDGESVPFTQMLNVVTIEMPDLAEELVLELRP